MVSTASAPECGTKRFRQGGLARSGESVTKRGAFRHNSGVRSVFRNETCITIFGDRSGGAAGGDMPISGWSAVALNWRLRWREEWLSAWRRGPAVLIIQPCGL